VRLPRTTSKRSARVAALALLAQRRLTEAQLWKKLLMRGYSDEEVSEAVARCKADGYVDDRLYATLYVEGARKAVGDARLKADLVKRGIDREAAATVVAEASMTEQDRLVSAYAKIVRVQPHVAAPSVARRLARLGFRTDAVYRLLRERMQITSFASETD
jgi:SOS response regulatory protein OraA/RecX